MFFTFILILSLLTPLRSEQRVLCGNMVFNDSDYIEFSKSEKALVCGDTGSTEWSDVSLSESKYYLGVFLRNRAYYNYAFSVENNKLIVKTGNPTYIKSITVKSDIPNLSSYRNKNIYGKKLVTEQLDFLEKTVIKEIQSKGYICPLVKAYGDSDKGEVVIDIKAGKKYTVLIKEEQIKELSPGTIKRYYAFREGDVFNRDLLELTDKRINSDGIVYDSNFIIRCSDKNGEITHTITPGKPRLVSFGAGLSSEEYLILKGAWKNARIGLKGSQINFEMLVSHRRQILQGEDKWFFSDRYPRIHLLTSGTFERKNEKFYESMTISFKAAPASTFDNESIGLLFSLGPSIKYIKTTKGSGREDSLWFSIESQLKLQSHDYEMHSENPRDGYMILFNGDFTSVQRLELKGTILKDYGYYDFPLIVTGIRAGILTTIAGNSGSGFKELPPYYRHYIGGASTLRGFSRQELPANGEGSPSAFYLGLEIRFPNMLPYSLEPYIFSDLGLLGRVALSVNAPLYYSPGAGIRWGTIIGPIRVSLARGFIKGADTGTNAPHWQFYFSIGEEF